MAQKPRAKGKAERGTPTTRPPLDRMIQIHQQIQAGRYPNATSLARELEVSSKSIQRDLEFMRDRMSLPLVYDALRKGYYYTEEVSAFPTMQISEGELFALLVAEKALQQYRGTNFERPLVSAFKKMASSLPDTVSLNLADWEQTISFRTTAEPLLNLDTFELLRKALGECRQLKLRYRKPGQKEGDERIVDPYHLANINGEWFLYAYDHLRHDVRTFAPARISRAEYTGKKFPRPERFSLEKRLRDSFGVISGSKEQTVVIRFDEFAADFIREKRWHPSQKLKELPEGGAELSMKLSSLIEVQRWILHWGGHARAVEPPELVEAVRTAVAALQKSLGT